MYYSKIVDMVYKNSEIHRSTHSENGILEKDEIKGHIYDFDSSTGKGYKIDFANDGRPGSVLREKKVNFSKPVYKNFNHKVGKKYRKTPMPTSKRTRHKRRVSHKRTRKQKDKSFRPLR